MFCHLDKPEFDLYLHTFNHTTFLNVTKYCETQGFVTTSLDDINKLDDFLRFLRLARFRVKNTDTGLL